VCAAIAIALFAPNLVWQMANGWPTLAFMRGALEEKYVRASLGAFALDIALMTNPVAAPLLVAGLVAPFVAAPLRAFRPVAIVILTTIAIVVSSGSGKAEYLLAATPILLALGATWGASVIERLRPRVRVAAVAAIGVPMLAIFALTAPLALPVLPVDDFVRYAKWLGVAPSTNEKKELAELPQFYADMYGWHELADAAALAFATLRDDEKGCAKIMAVTGGYGPAAAIDFFGRSRGLPRAVSGHNSYWLWGYGKDERCAVVLLGGKREVLASYFDEVTPITTVECGRCMPYENHKPVYVARGMHASWAEAWPTIRHYE
jgi:hypothetical protein